MRTLRRRYLAVQVDSTKSVSDIAFMDAVWKVVTQLFGEHGASKTGLRLIEYIRPESLVILRTWHTSVEMVRTALATVTNLDGNPVSLRVLTVSGTIRALRYKVLESISRSTR